MSEDQLSEMNREWRGEVMQELRGVRTQLAELSGMLSEHRVNAAEKQEVRIMWEHINSLEAFKWKAVGAIIGISGIFSFLGWFFRHS